MVLRLGLPSSIAAGCKACCGQGDMREVRSEGEGKEWVRSRARSGQGAEQVVKGGNLIQLDYQTTVHERRVYMLYSRMRNKSMKWESTEEGEAEEQETGNMWNNKQIQRPGRMEVL
jgi:hypothetical protein